MSSLASLLGPELIGFAFNWALQGAFSVQVYIYYLCFPTDSIYLKCIVYSTLVLEWSQTALLTSSSFYRFAAHYGDFASLLSDDVFWITLFIMPAFTAAMVQSFYAWRISILSQRRIFTIVVLFFVVFAFVAGIVGAVSLKNLYIFSSQYGDDALTWDVATNVALVVV
ncbi:hypothetical protein EVJ58_g838 [Rhodofomes roseus]|uniref:Uncharacterized protein n=1 Tax=Rhodofomes roseus TaxID=34475 RepID=A0A4Y9Z4D3_9APHY|nr:hypothetical protein EVJ58_g838 [Rhodofomes roseus]